MHQRLAFRWRECPTDYDPSPTVRKGWRVLLEWDRIEVDSALREGGHTKQRRFSDEQIIAIVKEQDAGTKTTYVCRKRGISDATFYKLEEKYGGLEMSEARRLKPLEDDKAAPKEIAGKTRDT